MTARADYIAGLRALADLIESTPELPLPESRNVAWYLFGTSHTGDKLTDAEQKERAAALVRLLPGEQRKWDTGDLFRFCGHVGGIKTEVIVDRSSVCERVVTGTREVEKQIPTAFDTVTETVEDVRWECRPLLAEVEH